MYFKKEHFLLMQDRSSRMNQTLVQLQEDLHLKFLPLHIECFDNSNIQGTSPVASMVCFRNGQPSKKDYRKFNIRTVEGPDDFASMEEIVFRRYKRLQDEKAELPQLVIIDGGKGQLSSAMGSLKKLGIYGQIAVIGIAKKLEEIYFPEDELPLHIDKRSPSLKMIQKIRDEAHRFAITFHRKKRGAASIKSLLDEIEGIGEKTKFRLLQHYKTIQKIMDAPSSDLEKLIGRDKANRIILSIKKEVKPG